MNLTHSLEKATDTITDALGMKVSDARTEWLEFRIANDFGISATNLLTSPDHQPKTGKNAIPTYVLHLAPSTASSVNTCMFSTAGCSAACLNTAGRGRFDSVQKGRISKTEFLAENPNAFIRILHAEIVAAVRRHDGQALFRLNGTSDLRWERIVPAIFEIPGADFYDYTKWPRRDGTPDNYAIAYSASERDSDADLIERSKSFGHIAVVVDVPARTKGELPETFLGLPACDGDQHDDWREREVMVLLRMKGDALDDDTGFVRKAS